MDSRDLFEVWAGDNDLSLGRHPVFGHYLSKSTESAWGAWQAATKRAVKLCEGALLAMRGEDG